MAQAKPIYDLTLLLDLGAADDERAKIVSDARTAISAEGELLAEQAWGTRPLAYEIGHRESAEYHLLQFHGPATLIAGLEHSLRITDGVIRHRVIKLPAGATAASSAAPPPAVVPPPASSAPAAPAADAPPEDAPAAGEPAADAPVPDAPAAEAPVADAQAVAAADESAPAADADAQPVSA
jgi:small subunit ribosomal protein S6